MKILFVSLFLPMEKSYHAGGRYVFELLRQLAQHHEGAMLQNTVAFTGFSA